MKEIVCSGGERVVVDDEDFEKFSGLSWSLNNAGYAHAHVPRHLRPEWMRPNRTEELLHRLITNPSLGMCVDHRNENRQDCQRQNLRVTTPTVNIRRKRLGASAGIEKSGRGFCARIKVKKKPIYLGTYDTFDLALLARVVAEIRYWGAPASTL